MFHVVLVLSGLVLLLLFLLKMRHGVIKTPLGQIEVRKNGFILPYSPLSLSKKKRWFSVDGRYSFILERLSPGDELSITVAVTDAEKITPNIEPGEQLSVLSLETEAVKVSIGTTGDMPGMDYRYLENGLCLRPDTSFERLPVLVAWKYMVHAEDGINTWFAVDPALLGRKDKSRR